MFPAVNENVLPSGSEVGPLIVNAGFVPVVVTVTWPPTYTALIVVPNGIVTV